MTHRPPTAPAVCAQRDHEGTERCPLHGCPVCLLETLPYDDSPLTPALLPEDQEHAQELADDLHDEVVEGRGGTCLVCTEIVWRRSLARYPGWDCELEDCLHCIECDACSRTAQVCRWCRRCANDEAEPGDEDGSQCERYRWSRALLRDVTYYRHSYLDPATGRWSR